MVYGISGRALQVPLVSIGVDCSIWDSVYTLQVPLVSIGVDCGICIWDSVVYITSATSEYRC